MSRLPLLLKSFGLLLIFILQVVLARLMGVRDYGDYTVIMTWINILIIFCLFGFNHSAPGILTFFYDNMSRGKTRGFVRFSFRFILGVSLLCMIVLFWFLFSNARKHSLTYTEAFFWSIFLIPLLVIINQCSALFSAIHKAKQLFSVNILLPLSITVAVTISYFVNGKLLRLDTVVFLSLLCAFFIAWFMNVNLKRELRPMYDDALPEYQVGTWIKASAILLAFNFFPVLLRQVDILFVGYFLGNSKAGIYASAARFATIIPVISASLESFYGSANVEVFQKTGEKPLRKYFSGKTGTIVISTLAAALLLIAFGKYFLSMYGKDFQASYIPLIILTVGQLISALVLNYCGSLMNAETRMNTVIVAYLLSTVLTVLLNCFFIPFWGLTGAAWSTSISLVALSAGVYLLSRRKLV